MTSRVSIPTESPRKSDAFGHRRRTTQATRSSPAPSGHQPGAARYVLLSVAEPAVYFDDSIPMTVQK
jgi:hypothetical protein